MSDVNPFTALLKPHAEALMLADKQGDNEASEVIRLYRMHCDAPRDPGALGIGMAAAEAWIKKNRMEQA